MEDQLGIRLLLIIRLGYLEFLTLDVGRMKSICMVRNILYWAPGCKMGLYS